MLRIADLMTPSPVTVSPDTPVADCGRTMLRLRLRHLLVVDAAGALQGALSDFVVFSKGAFAGQHGELWVAFEPDDFALKASALPLAEVSTVAASAPLMLGLRLLGQRGQELVVAVDDNGHPVGIITEHDVARLAAVGLDVSAPVLEASSAPLATVDLDTPAARALGLMRARGMRHLVVLSDGALAGVLSARDLLSENVTPDDPRRVDEVLLRRDVLTADGVTSLREAAERMAHHKVGCLPILNTRGQPVGIITRSDLVQAMLSQLEGAASFQED